MKSIPIILDEARAKNLARVMAGFCLLRRKPVPLFVLGESGRRLCALLRRRDSAYRVSLAEEDSFPQATG
jgi:hypothetical protein